VTIREESDVEQVPVLFFFFFNFIIFGAGKKKSIEAVTFSLASRRKLLRL
jgi:hypothetical protein